MKEFYLTKRIDYLDNGVLEFDKTEFVSQKLDDYTIQSSSVQISFYDTYAIVSAKLSQKPPKDLPGIIVGKRQNPHRY